MQFPPQERSPQHEKWSDALSYATTSFSLPFHRPMVRFISLVTIAVRPKRRRSIFSDSRMQLSCERHLGFMQRTRSKKSNLLCWRIAAMKRRPEPPYNASLIGWTNRAKARHFQNEQSRENELFRQLPVR